MLAPEKNREHSIKLQLPAWNVGFMRRLRISRPCLMYCSRISVKFIILSTGYFIIRSVVFVLNMPCLFMRFLGFLFIGRGFIVLSH
ncbi:hypothetical protein B0B36_20100 [Pseudomonas syringae pv. actinidifoliorum]|nr:hypothetical protein B0B36_20100 [Pseudomonas syringae pv. actinidifoliorum]